MRQSKIPKLRSSSGTASSVFSPAPQSTFFMTIMLFYCFIFDLKKKAKRQAGLPAAGASNLLITTPISVWPPAQPQTPQSFGPIYSSHLVLVKSLVINGCQIPEMTWLFRQHSERDPGAEKKWVPISLASYLFLQGLEKKKNLSLESL